MNTINEAHLDTQSYDWHMLIAYWFNTLHF